MSRSVLFSRFVLTLLMLPLLGLFSASGQAVTQQSASTLEALQSARHLFIRQRSTFMNREAFERELLKRPEFRDWNLIIVRNLEEADLVVEITRKKWTTRFTLMLLDPTSNHLLASAEASSLGGEIEPKLADRFIRLIKAACAR